MGPMKKIINWFKKHLNSVAVAVQGSLANNEQCDKRGLHLEKRELNRIVALFIIIGVALFVGGYFLGQHTATEQVLNSVERDSFADQIYYSMCSAQEQKDEEDEQADEEQTNDQQEPISNDDASQSAAVDVKEQATQIQPRKTYYAQIAGFGQQKTAEKYAQRLKNNGFKVHVVKRISRSARGKTISWYQVVTDDFHDVQEGERVISLLRVQENLRNIALVEK
jgi:cell division protein FtsN